jgi:hypothetical protein
MYHNKRHFHLSGFFAILMAIMACALPGQTVSPQIPTIDPNTLATSVAGTAQASVQLTQQASIPTSIPATSTPRISPITATSLGKLEDQSTLFIDHKAGIQLTIPAGWLPVRANEDEYYKAFSLDVVLSNPLINDRITKLASLNTDNFRVEAIDIRPEHLGNGFISIMDVIFQPGDLRTLEKWAQAERNKKSPLKGHKFLSSKIQETADGTRVLVIEESWPNGDVTTYYRGVFFSLPTGTIVLDFYTSLDFKDTVFPEFEQVVNSLTALTP